MNKSRRIGAIVAMATTAVGLASMAASAPASASASVARGPEPVSGWLRPVRAHTTSSIDIYWRTDRTICDVQVRVAAPWVNVDYPGHQQFASFQHGDTLRAGGTGYTTMQVNPAFDQATTARLLAVIGYDSCAFHARPRTKSFTFTLPVLSDNNRPGHGFPGGPGNGGPGNGGPGNGGPGNGGPVIGGPAHHGQPIGSPSPTISPNSSPSPTSTPTASPTTASPTTTSASPTGNGGTGHGADGTGGNAHGGNGGDSTGGNGHGGHAPGGGTQGPMVHALRG